jgi:hypothetical protein
LYAGAAGTGGADYETNSISGRIPGAVCTLSYLIACIMLAETIVSRGLAGHDSIQARTAPLESGAVVDAGAL